ncbi:MAG: DUF861 domain-containing protein [Bauldia sp.]|uniref:cupin domain-containing protein n=1 Tax=Bauldia sp. TaxID=2575872 RepID=UPI001D2B84AE|nr:cupin domain-containing protein [Bauldia sp.]MCB1494712.1 DUF861 domain-containing protein [Bauldia sp.]
MADYRQSIPMSDPAIAGAFDRTRGDAPAAPKRRTVGGTIVTVVATLAIVGAVGLALKAPAVFGYKADLGVAQAHELQPSPIDPSWIISGDPEFNMTVFERSSFWATSSGIWECIGPGKFVWHYTVDEDIYILDGSAEIEYMGKTITLHPGESTRFVAGTSATWVVEDHIRKTFRIQNPGRIVKALRMVSDSIGL